MARELMHEGATKPLRRDSSNIKKRALLRGSISLAGRLLSHRELDDAVGVSDTAASMISDPRSGKVGRHQIAAAALPRMIFTLMFGLVATCFHHAAVGAPNQNVTDIPETLRICVDAATKDDMGQSWDRSKDMKIFFGITDDSQRPALHGLLNDMVDHVMKVAKARWRFTDDIATADLRIVFAIDGNSTLSKGTEAVIGAHVAGDEDEAASLRDDIISLEQLLLMRMKWNWTSSFRIVDGKAVDQPHQEKSHRLVAIKIGKKKQLQFSGLAGAIMAALTSTSGVMELASCPGYEGVLSTSRQSLSFADKLFLTPR